MTQAYDCAILLPGGDTLIRYHKLFDLLTRRAMRKSELQEQATLSWTTMAKLSKGDTVTTEVINRVCTALQCQPGDIMEWEPDQPDGEP